MEPMTFSEFLGAMNAYREYMKETGERSDEAMAKPAEVVQPQEEPEPVEAPQNIDMSDDLKALRELVEKQSAELDQLKKRTVPSMSNVEPVGIDDVVARFFNKEN